MTRGGKREGAGRPALPDKRRTRTLKFTDEEWQQIKKVASELNMTAAEYVRLRLYVPRPKEDK